jgi:hypothetical protein
MNSFTMHGQSAARIRNRILSVLLIAALMLTTVFSFGMTNAYAEENAAPVGTEQTDNARIDAEQPDANLTDATDTEETDIAPADIDGVEIADALRKENDTGDTSDNEIPTGVLEDDPVGSEESLPPSAYEQDDAGEYLPPPAYENDETAENAPEGGVGALGSEVQPLDSYS